MGINSENNNENLKQQEAMANAIDGATAGAQQFANATEAAGKAGKKMTGSLAEITEGIDDFTEGLDKALKSIHLLPGAIEEYTKVANKNMAYAAEDIREGFIKGIFNEKLWAVRAELGRETEELKIAMEQARKSMEQAEASNDEYEKHTAKLRFEQLSKAYEERKGMKVSQQLNKKLAYDMKTELLKIGKKMFSDLWNYAKKILDEAYTKDKSTIEQNYGTIMSYNSYNHGEYAKLIDRLQEKIEASGLGDTISVNTLQENLVKTLQSGLQGALAESNAYYASIAEKAGITFDWYGSEWTTLISQMNRTGKDYEQVMKSVITTTDDLAEIYGDSKGLSEGRANQMMAAASSLGTTYGLSEDAIGNIYKSLAVTSQELTNYGIDTNNFVQDITGALQSGLSNQDLGVIFGTGGATGDQVEQKIKEGKFDELILQYMNNLEDMYKGQNTEMVNALQGALGSSFSTTDYQAFQTYWEQEGSFSTNFEKAMGKSNSSIGDIEGELKNYVTTQESYETKMENSMADIAEWMVQNPIAEVLGKTIQTGINSIIGILLAYLGNKTLNSILSAKDSGTKLEFGKSTLNSLKSSFSNIWKGKQTNILKSGYNIADNGAIYAPDGSFASASDAYTKTNGLNKFFSFGSKPTGVSQIGGGTTLGAGATTIGGGLALIAGTTMAINDAKKAEENGINGWKGAIGGYTEVAKNEKDVAAQVAKNTAKGALIGGGAAALGAGIAGMATGAAVGSSVPVIGTAIGAVVGLVAGVTVGIVEYNKASNVLLRNTANLAEGLAKTAESTAEVHAEFQKLHNIYEAREAAENNNTEAVQSLVQQFPVLSKYVDDSGNKLDGFDRVLDNLIKSMEAETNAKGIGNVNEVFKDTSVKEIKKGHGAMYSGLKDIAKWSNIDKNSEQKGTLIDSGSITDISEGTVGEGNAEWVKTSSGEKIKAEKIVDQLISVGVLDGHDDVSGWDIKEVVGLAQHAGILTGKDYVDDYKTKIDSLTTKATELQSLATEIQSLESFAQNMDLAAYLEQYETHGHIPGINVQEFATNWDKAMQMAWAVHKANDYYANAISDATQYRYETAKEFAEGTFTALPSTVWSNEEFRTAMGLSVKPPDSFAVGTTGDSTIPYDNYLALLHRGEQVRTSAEVALEEANKHIASSETSRAIHDVVLNQTNTIISILTNIYDVLANSTRTSVAKAGSIVYDLPGV